MLLVCTSIKGNTNAHCLHELKLQHDTKCSLSARVETANDTNAPCLHELKLQHGTNTPCLHDSKPIKSYQNEAIQAQVTPKSTSYKSGSGSQSPSSLGSKPSSPPPLSPNVSHAPKSDGRGPLIRFEPAGQLARDQIVQQIKNPKHHGVEERLWKRLVEGIVGKIEILKVFDHTEVGRNGTQKPRVGKIQTHDSGVVLRRLVFTAPHKRRILLFLPRTKTFLLEVVKPSQNAKSRSGGDRAVADDSACYEPFGGRDLQQRLSARPELVARLAEPQLAVEAEAADEQRSTEAGLCLPRSSRSFLPRSRHPPCSGKDQFTFFFSTVRTITTAAQPEVQVKLSLQRVDECAEKCGFCSNPDRDLDPSSFPHDSLVCPVCNSTWKGVIPHGTCIIFFSQPFSAYIATYQDPTQNVERSRYITMMEPINGRQDLHVSVTMSSIKVGTVGRGTQLTSLSQLV
ncbi:hypothetical protein TB2_033095 [Malus domestica]